MESKRLEELIRPTDETSAWREPLGSRFESKAVPAMSQRPIRMEPGSECKKRVQNKGRGSDPDGWTDGRQTVRQAASTGKSKLQGWVGVWASITHDRYPMIGWYGALPAQC